jgi:hypothetical protein
MERERGGVRATQFTVHEGEEERGGACSKQQSSKEKKKIQAIRGRKRDTVRNTMKATLRSGDVKNRTSTAGVCRCVQAGLWKEAKVPTHTHTHGGNRRRNKEVHSESEHSKGLGV